MIKKILISFLTFVSCLSNPKALIVNGLYGDMGATASQTENLLLYANNLDSNFLEKDFIIFRSAQYEYYIVWGDLTYNGTSVDGTNVDFIRYSRNESMIYSYFVGNDPTFSLTNIDYLVTSNIPELGISSPVYETMEYERNIINLAILSASAVLGVFILKLRKE